MGEFSSATRATAYSRSGGKCWFCGLRLAQDVEHLTPKARGGKNDYKNLVGACKLCNTAKAGHHMSGNPNWNLEEFRAEVADRLEIQPEEVIFYGERLQINRQATAKLHEPAIYNFIIYGQRDDLVDIPEGIHIPPFPKRDDDDVDF